jgi:hypothetical protein
MLVTREELCPGSIKNKIPMDTHGYPEIHWFIIFSINFFRHNPYITIISIFQQIPSYPYISRLLPAIWGCVAHDQHICKSHIKAHENLHFQPHLADQIFEVADFARWA